jgi:hypothetical protein
MKRNTQIRNNKSIHFLDETDYLLSTSANKVALLNGLAQFEKGDNGKTIQIADLWK